MRQIGAMLGVCLLGVQPAQGADTLSIVDAVRSALERNPALKASREAVNVQRGRVRAADAPFDWNLDKTERFSHESTTIPGALSAYTYAWRLGLNKRFGWGTVITPNVTLSRSTGEIIDVPGEVGQNVATVSFAIVQPVLRGVGSAARSELDAASFEYEAAKQDYLHALNARIASVVAAYWSYAAARRNLDIFLQSEARAKKLLEEFTALVQADERPASDLEQLEASLAERMRDRFSGEQALAEARYAVALEMGLDWDEMESVGPPASPLPAIHEASQEALNGRAAMLELARTRRRDLVAAQGRIQAAESLVSGAVNGMLPQLDLLADVGYAGAEDGRAFHRYFSSLGHNVPGVNFNVSLRLLWPMLNDGAAGVLDTARASHRQAVLARQAVLQQVGAGVSSALVGVATGASALERARAAAVRYQKSVDNERRKLQAGLSTIIDVTFTEDRLNSARLAETNQHLAYANAVLRLRFETATIAEIRGDRGEVDEVRLTTPPAVSAQ